MLTCSPREFLRRWPKSLRPIAIPEPHPALPEDCRSLLAEYGLPREVTIYCYNDITLRFSGSATPLAAIWKRDLQRGCRMGDMPAEWSRLWHLADQIYLQGGGWICVEEVTGRMVVIDLDLSDPISVLNSSVANFYTTLAHFLDWSEKTCGTPAATFRLRDALAHQQCVPSDELEPFWMNFIDATLDGDPINVIVTLGQKEGRIPAWEQGGE